MRIALVILHADPARGGAERYTIDLAAALARRGHDVSVLATSFAELPSDVHRVDLRAAGVSRAGRYQRMLESLDLHLEKNAYDIVHTMLPVKRCDVYHPHAGIAAEMSHWSDSLLRRRRRMMAIVERKLLLRDDGPVVLCLSDYIKGFVRSNYRLPESRLATLFNAVDIARFDPQATVTERARMRKELGIAEDGRESVMALCVAQDFARKGVPQVLAALQQPGAEQIALVVVGKDDPGECQSAARESGVSEKVRFVGSTVDPRGFYSAADFFVLPTRHDPCSLVVLEALAMGLPVISTRFNGACEIMTDGIHGFILDDWRDIDGLTSAMSKMLDPELRRRMSEACLKLRPRLAYEHHLRSLLDIYEQVVARRRGLTVRSPG